jgi:hypothetical protein
MAATLPPGEERVVAQLENYVIHRHSRERCDVRQLLYTTPHAKYKSRDTLHPGEKKLERKTIDLKAR